MSFFESLAKKSSTTMDDLFRPANKYSMLENDVYATTRQFLVTNRPIKHDETDFKPSNQSRQASKMREPIAAEVGKTNSSQYLI